MSRKTAVLYSGGIDSTVMANLIARTGDLELLVAFDTGQAAFENEILPRLRAVGAALACNYEVARMDYKRLTSMRQRYAPGYQRPVMFEPGAAPEQGGTREDLDDKLSTSDHFGWLEGRNAVMLVQAATIAVHYGCTSLATGTQTNEYERGINTGLLPNRGEDTNLHTIRKANELIYTSFSQPFAIHAPFAFFSKEQVYRLGLSLGVPLTSTYSCEYSPRCGKCSQCLEVMALHKKYRKPEDVPFVPFVCADLDGGVIR